MQLLNRVLIVLAAISLVVVAVFWCIQTIFSSGDSLNSFLITAQTYTGLNAVIQDQLTVDFKADRLSDALISASKTVTTPELSQHLLRPSLNALISWLQVPATNAPLLLRLDLRQFKEALAEQLSGNTSAANASAIHFQTVASVPDSVVLVDNTPATAESRRLFELIKTVYRQSQQYLPIALMTSAALLAALLLINIGQLGRMLRSISWPFVLAGGAVVIAGLLGPIVVQQFFMKAPPLSAQAASSYIGAGLASAIMTRLLPYGYGFGVAGLGGVVVATIFLRPSKHKRKRHGR